MKNQSTTISLRLLARIAGILYLIVIVGGIFSEVFVRQELMVYEDPVATANNIIQKEGLYRLGFVIGLVYLMCNIPLVLIFHEIFKSANRFLALLFLLFFLTGNILEIMNMINHYLPLDFVEIGANLEGLGKETSAALAYMSLSTHSTGFSISLVFFGCYCLLLGYLIYTSDFLPKLIGLLMVIAGICYLFDSFSVFLAPEFAESLFPYIFIPCFLAELSLAIWLLAKGIKSRDVRI